MGNPESHSGPNANKCYAGTPKFVRQHLPVTTEEFLLITGGL